MNNPDILSLPAGFAPTSRVWIYQADRPFTPAETTETRRLLTAFVNTWNSHGHPVKGFADLFYSQFIILMADETASGVSGCSTDSSVHLIKQIEQQTGTGLFDRLNLAFYPDGQVLLIPMAELPTALGSGRLNAETLYFNNTAKTKAELEEKWLIPLKDSWLATRYLQPVLKG
jgi:hypothetical protein